MAMSIIEVKELTKIYKNGKKAVNSVSFTISKGQVFGFLGPNGSGKSTLLSMLLSLVKPTSGSIKLFNSLDMEQSKSMIGASLEVPGFLPFKTAEENLRLSALIKESESENLSILMEVLNVQDFGKLKFSQYSLGMKQRLSITSALIGKPELVIFDEPTNGLDPAGIIEVRNLILRLRSEGKTIIIASHILSEIEKICTHIAIISKGVIRSKGPIEEIYTEYGSLENAYMTNTTKQVLHEKSI